MPSDSLGRWRRKESLLPEPSGARVGPGGVGMAAGPDAEVVGGRGVDVQFGRDAGSLESQVHEQAVLGIADNIV